MDELNYLKEANNAQVFMDSIALTSLKNVVFAPAIIQELSTKKVLVVEMDPHSPRAEILAVRSTFWTYG